MRCTSIARECGLLCSIVAVCGWSQSPSPQMRAGLGIRFADDEVLKLAVQVGVRDVVIYGGPGSGFVPGTRERLKGRRASYEQYLALRKRLESFGLRLTAMEGRVCSSCSLPGHCFRWSSKG